MAICAAEVPHPLFYTCTLCDGTWEPGDPIFDEPVETTPYAAPTVRQRMLAVVRRGKST